MSHLILVRHGQSEWNLENRFTGWVDVDLAPKGKLEACKAGELVKELNLDINHYFSSYQKRAIETLKLILNTMRIKNDKVIRAWELNERHYGSLTIVVSSFVALTLSPMLGSKFLNKKDKINFFVRKFNNGFRSFTGFYIDSLQYWINKQKTISIFIIYTISN